MRRRRSSCLPIVSTLLQERICRPCVARRTISLVCAPKTCNGSRCQGDRRVHRPRCSHSSRHSSYGGFGLCVRRGHLQQGCFVHTVPVRRIHLIGLFGIDFGNIFRSLICGVQVVLDCIQLLRCAVLEDSNSSELVSEYRYERSVNQLIPARSCGSTLRQPFCGLPSFPQCRASGCRCLGSRFLRVIGRVRTIRGLYGACSGLFCNVFDRILDNPVLFDQRITQPLRCSGADRLGLRLFVVRLSVLAYRDTFEHVCKHGVTRKVCSSPKQHSFRVLSVDVLAPQAGRDRHVLRKDPCHVCPACALGGTRCYEFSRGVFFDALHHITKPRRVVAHSQIRCAVNGRLAVHDCHTLQCLHG